MQEKNIQHMTAKNYKVAIIHDWLTGMRGGEKVLELLISLYPNADIFTLLWIKGSVSPQIEKQHITTSFLQKAPFIKNNYRHYLPFFPMAIESFDLNGYDLVISSSHCVAKGVIPPPQARHFCYCYTPMRYIWNMYYDYFKDERNIFSAIAYRSVAHYLRIWDISANSRVDDFAAISEHISRRIQRYYNRPSTVIYPPVDTEYYHPVPDRAIPEPYYLIVSALVPYKKVDLAVEAFNLNGKKLVVIGEGPGKAKLRKKAKDNISFLGWESNEQLRQWYSHCSALIFPGEEDFGIVPLEAQACGSPVIAYRKGGATETIIDRQTGIFFDRQTIDELQNAVNVHEKMTYDKKVIIANAKRFSNEIFCENIRNHMRQVKVS
jgi:glycosyltransferase involved in cell wall biosynthesis